MPQYLAIDVDASGLFVAAGSVKNGTVVVEAVASDTDAVPALSKATAVEVGNRLKQLLASSGIRPAPVLLCLGRDRFVPKSIKYPRTDPEEEPAIVRFQALKELSEAANDVAIDYCPITSPSEIEQKATVVFVRRELILAAKVVCETAGLRLAAVTPRYELMPALLAQAAALGTIAGSEGESDPVAVVNLWKGGGEFTVVAGSQVRFARAISAQATESEHALLGEIRRNLLYHDGQYVQSPVKSLYLAESSLPGTGWSGRIGTGLSVPVSPFDPLEGTSPKGEVPDSCRGRFAGPVGLLTSRAAGGGLSINFIQPRQPKAAANANKTRALVGVLLGLLVLSTLVAGGFMLVDGASRKLRTANSEKIQLDQQMKSMEADMKRLAAADEFRKREVVWLDELYDLTDRLPNHSKIRVSEFDGTALAPKRQATRGPARPQAGGTAIAAAPKGPNSGISGGTPGGTAQRPGGLAAAKEKPEPIAQIRVSLLTDDATLVEQFVDSTTKEGYYTGTLKTITGSSASSSSMQQFTMTTQLLHRTSGDYTRKFVPPPPPKQPVEKAPEPKPADEADTKPDDDFNIDIFGGSFP